MRDTGLMSLFPATPVEPFPLERGMIGVHANSLTNELCSLYNRVLMEVPSMGPQGCQAFKRAAKHVQTEVFRKVGLVQPWKLREALHHMVVRHGAGLYVPAAESLRDRPLDRRDSGVSMFIKVEKNFISEGLSLKTPRAIQYRGPRFNLMLAKYLLPFEKKFYEEFSTPNSSGLHTSKGLSPDARARLIVDLWGKFDAPAALCLDASRFDAHVAKTHLLEEATCYYNSLGKHRLLRWLLKRQLVNTGRGRWGTRYKVEGCRMSGDMNTALGNTLIQLMVLKHCAGDEQVSLLVEGDDAIMFGNVDAIRRVEAKVNQRALDVGFTMKCALALFVEEIDYCSSRVIQVGPGEWRSVRAGYKAFFTDRYTSKRVEGEKAIREKARTMATGYNAMYSGLPLYGAWAQYLLSWAPPCKLDERYDAYFIQRAALAARDRWVSSGAAQSEVTPMARESFYCATGMPPSEQLLIENLFHTWKGPFTCTNLDLEVQQLLSLAKRLGQ